MLNKTTVVIAVLLTLSIPSKYTPTLCWWSLLYPQAQSTVTNDNNTKPVVKIKLFEFFTNN